MEEETALPEKGKEESGLIQILDQVSGLSMISEKANTNDLSKHGLKLLYIPLIVMFRIK